tara:strand:+ start:27738 stop:28232 length:495 start_codon:yes stop_codon:yes gene_type:complete
MKAKLFIVILMILTSSCQEEEKVVAPKKNLYDNNFISPVVMEKLDDFIGGYNSLKPTNDSPLFYNLVIFSDESSCYVSFMESPQNYNHQEIIGHFKFEGKTIIVYLDDSRCSYDFIKIENLDNQLIEDLTDISDTNNITTHNNYTANFIIYEIIGPDQLIYVPF